MRFSRFAKFAPIGVALLPFASFAADPTTGLEAITQLRTNMGDYGPVMFGLSIVSVGVLIGVKWIKRARGAA